MQVNIEGECGDSRGMTGGSCLTQEELLAIRFYMGDPEAVANGCYRGGPAAYNTMNALLHPGSANEKDKALEGRCIMLEDPDHLKEYLNLILAVFRAMERYRRYCLAAGTIGKHRVTWRMDRMASLERFRRDGYRVAGFFSTCKRGLLPEYARSKVHVVMLEVERDETVPFLDFEDIFGACYAKPEEAEILLPFDMRICEMAELPVMAEERERFRDLHGEPPVGKWRLRMTMGDDERQMAAKAERPDKDVSGRISKGKVMSADTVEGLYRSVTDEGTAAKAAGCMERLTAKQPLTVDEEMFYANWKRDLQAYIRAELSL